jgi:hypothetical protein
MSLRTGLTPLVLGWLLVVSTGAPAADLQGPAAFDPHSRDLLFGIPLIDLPNFQDVADFTGDGIPDLAGLATNSIVIRPGVGDGTWGADIFTPMSAPPLTFSITADFDGDGKRDLAVAGWDGGSAGSLSIMRGRGDGRFDLVQSLGTARRLTTMVAGDVTGDGKADLAYGQACGPNNCHAGGLPSPETLLFVYRNLGDGALTPMASYSGVGPAVASAAADVDGDGDLDLAFSGQTVNTARHLLINSGAGFIDYTFPVPADALAAADLNGDGRKEFLAVSLLAPTLKAVRMDTGPVVQATYTLPAPVEGLTTADFNGDGSLDVALSSSFIMYGNGLGALSPAPGSSASSFQRLRASDLDGDGHLDLVSGHASGRTAVLTNRGDDSFAVTGPLIVTDRVDGFVTGGFDAGWRQDVVVVRIAGSQGPSPRTEILTLQGSPQGLAPLPQPIDLGFIGTSHPATADFDGDGRLDLATRLDSSVVGLFLGDGQGHFPGHATVQVGRTQDSLLIPILTADFNDDSRADIVAAIRLPDGSDTAKLLLGRGDATFEAPLSVWSGTVIMGDQPRFAAGDFDSDGHQDLAIVSYYAEVAVLHGHGDGTFDAPQTYAAPNGASLLVVDFDGDGHLDILTIPRLPTSFNTVNIMYGDGNGQFGDIRPFQLSSTETGLTAADFDGDGFADLLTTNSSYDIAVYYGGPGRSFSEPYRFASGRGMPVPFDYNLDGSPDVALATDFNNQSGIALLLNRNGPPAGPPPVVAIAGSQVVECNAPGQGTVSLDGSASATPGSPPGFRLDDYRWFLETAGGPQPVGTGPTLSIARPLGAWTIVLEVTDQWGQKGSSQVGVDVRDTTAPSLTLEALPSVLFPPNHRLVPVQVQWQVTDACDPSPSFFLNDALTDEADDAPGLADGDTDGDLRDAAVGSADGQFLLRAERSSLGDGREYRLRYRTADVSGNVRVADAVVAVPLTQEGVIDPIRIDVAHQAETPPPNGAVVISWTPVSPGLYYDVLVGLIGSQSVEDGSLCLGPTDLLDSPTSWPSVTENGFPLAPGEAAFYLVQYHDGYGNSGYGEESVPWPRLTDPCP